MTITPNTVAERFPILTAAAVAAGERTLDRFIFAVVAIAEGAQALSIRNTTLNDAKSDIGNVFSKAWDMRVSEPFLCGTWATMTDGERRLSRDINHYCLHDAIAASKKLAKQKLLPATHPMVVAMNAVIGEAVQLALAVQSLKAHVVKGRVVNPNAAPKEIPDTTCQICGRPILAHTGVIAHHGYMRPGHSYQTPSCFGARRVPYEQGHDALDELIPLVQTWLDTRKDNLHSLRKNPPAVLKYTPNSLRHVKYVPDDQKIAVPCPSDFDAKKVEDRGSYTMHSYESLWSFAAYEIKTAIRNFTEELAFLKARRAAWKALVQ
jgi:hypothetical protein